MTGANTLVDLRVARLMCSRLCHDLAGPAGAVNAGLEVLGESEGGDKEAAALVADSAAEISNRLAFYRVAFGAGAGETAAQARALAIGFLDNGRVSLDWPEDGALNVKLAAGGAKLILNIILLGVDALPRGGAVSVRLAEIPEGTGVAVTAAAAGARLRDDIRAAMNEAGAPNVSIDALTARNIHGYLAALLAKNFGGAIEVLENQKDKVRLAALIPPAIPPVTPPVTPPATPPVT